MYAIIHLALVLGLSSYGGNDGDEDARFIGSWAVLEKELATCGVESLLDAPTCTPLKSLMQSKDCGFLLEMSNQLLGPHPVVGAFGLQAIQTKCPELGNRAGAAILLGSEQPASLLHGGYLKRISQIEDDAVFASLLDYAVSLPFPQPQNAAMFILSLNTSALEKWYRGSVRQMSMSWRAAILDILLDVERGRDKDGGTLLAEMKKLAETPGYPRVVYLGSVKLPDAHFKKLLIEVLNDPATSKFELMILCHRWKDFMRTNLKPDDLTGTATKAIGKCE